MPRWGYEARATNLTNQSNPLEAVVVGSARGSRGSDVVSDLRIIEHT